MRELREMVFKEVKPLEDAAYAAGKRDGAIAANNSIREAAMEKAARVLSGSNNAAGTSSPTTAVDLARRAKEIQAAARKEGREMGDIESVQRAYEEANVPWR
jgi:hypothetical protein